MKVVIEINEQNLSTREAKVQIAVNELSAAYLHLAWPEKRNRSGLYKRRHPYQSEKNAGIQSVIGPCNPLNSPKEPPKMTIPAHLEEMRRIGMIPTHSEPKSEGSNEFGLEPSMIAVSISDLVANLLRPCYHSLGLGKHRLFYLEDEPISTRDYWCVCFFHSKQSGPKLTLDRIRFDVERDIALNLSNENLVEQGLVWAAALVPLIVGGHALSAVEIAKNDYDLRQIIGTENDEALRCVYEGWFDQWDKRVEKVISAHAKSGMRFASYYHSILGLDESKNIHIYQMEGTLPDLANALANEGVVVAGLLDSGGSCALYDVWMESYLNHNWYFREPRGGILVFELTSHQRIPRYTPDSWFSRKIKVNT